MGRFELKRGLDFSTRTGVTIVISSRSKTSFCHLAENCLVIDALSGCGGCLLAAGHQDLPHKIQPCILSASWNPLEWPTSRTTDQRVILRRWQQRSSSS
jgi:hypothetical protein